jgi:hypothetical protein
VVAAEEDHSQLEPRGAHLVSYRWQPGIPHILLALEVNAVVSFCVRILLFAMPLITSFWIAQADGVYAVVSTTLLLAVVALVLRPGSR